MKNKVVFISLLVVILGIGCMAYNPAVIGGVRNGTALGLVLESGFSDTTIRLGFEANTSNSPIIFAGGKWYLSDIDSRFPMFLSAGLVGYLGSDNEVGPYISLVFDRFLNITPLFLEVGVDVVSSGKLQVQLGYFF
jgi:hypothetical protein